MATTHRRLAHVGQSQLVQSALPLRAQPAEHVWQSRPSYPSAHCAWRKASALSKPTSLSSARARVRFGLMWKNNSEGLLSVLMLVTAAGEDRRCRLPSQAAFESHSSILRHASEVTRPVCASFLQRSAESPSCRTTYSSRHEQLPECVRQLNLACRELHPDLHRFACQCPGSGMTMFFPGQKPLPDGHGVHSLPPPPRMYVPSWHGRHWPASGDALVREAHV